MKRIVLYFILILLFAGCERLLMEKDPEDTPLNNFEILWNTMDQKYAGFGYKEVDWDTLYKIYKPRIKNNMSDRALYDVLSDLLIELKDGHTDIRSPYGVSHYKYYYGFPENFDEEIHESYLAGIKGKTGPLTYAVIDSIGYVYVPTFGQEIAEEEFEKIMKQLKDLKGIIIDVRNNGGGSDANGNIIARHFFRERMQVETVHFKLGPDHDHFGTMPIYKEPGGETRYHKPTVILTNRYCFSACNSFVSWMSLLPHVSIVGDTTGGGGGTPYAAELPNGWTYRFTSNIIYRIDGLNIDFGIPPDHYVEITDMDIFLGKDAILEYALDLLK